MPRTPSLAALRLFQFVAATGSFGQAARAAHLSQPALSRSIRLLEEELGARLFDRTSRHVALTDSGAALLPIVERLTADYEHAFADLAHSFAGMRGRVVVGALPSMAATVVARAIASFRALRPQVEIVLHDALSGMLERELAERRIDFALTTPPDGAALRFEPLLDDPMVLVCAADDPLADGGPAGWRLFADHDFIAMAPGSSVRVLTDRVFAAAGLSVAPRYGCAQLATAAGLIEAGLGITALPRSTLAMLAGRQLATRPLAEPAITRTIGLTWRADRTLAPAADAFLDHLRGCIVDNQS